MRELLTADRTYYVRTDGNDANNGLTDDAAGAFLTIQQAIDIALDTLDLHGFDVTIQVGDGTYTEPTMMSGPQTGRGKITVQGNAAEPGHVVIAVTGEDCFVLSDCASLTLKDLELRTVTAGICLVLEKNSLCSFENIRFGPAATAHMRVSRNSSVDVIGNYTVAGSTPNHALISNCSTLYMAFRTVTLTGTPDWSIAFVFLADCSTLRAQGASFIGSATGSRYQVVGNSVIQTFGASASFLPGSLAGTALSGGQYC
jgi:hypothetical protein